MRLGEMEPGAMELGTWEPPLAMKLGAPMELGEMELGAHMEMKLGAPMEMEHSVPINAICQLKLKYNFFAFQWPKMKEE